MTTWMLASILLGLALIMQLTNRCLDPPRPLLLMASTFKHKLLLPHFIACLELHREVLECVVCAAHPRAETLELLHASSHA